MKIYHVAEMLAVEQEAIARGITSEQMVKKAGLGVGKILIERYGHLSNRIVTALIGPKNNGNDALVALSALIQAGWQARAYLFRPRIENDTLVQKIIDSHSPVIFFEEDGNFTQLTEWLKSSTLLLDGIVGTGIKLPLRPELAKLLAYISTQPIKPIVIAIDCPSGIDCETGQTAPDCIPANLTICIESVKSGLLTFPAFDFVGELAMVDLGLPKKMDAYPKTDLQVATRAAVKEMLPNRPKTGHKGTFGTALIISGSSNYTGAPLLSGRAAYRIGVGLVNIAVPGPVQGIIAGQLPEATWMLLPHDQGVISEDAADLVLNKIGQADAVLLGPGWGVEDTTRSFLCKFLQGENHKPEKDHIGFLKMDSHPKKDTIHFPPVVIDADGLKLLAHLDHWEKTLPSSTILTPHPGEMSILTGLSIEEIQSRRMDIALEYANKWNCIVVLKGALTVIASPDGKMRVIPIATTTLATAGTGDVLAGMITGLIAQKVTPFEAAVTGAYLHATAGITAAGKIGHEISVMATDVIECIPDAYKYCMG